MLLALILGCTKRAVVPEAVIPPPPPPTAQEALRPFYAGIELALPVGPASPADPEGDVATVVLGSCLEQARPAPILGPMQAVGADLAILLGDNVYGDARLGDATLPELRRAYATLSEVRGFAPFLGASPLLTTWDDHDYGMNDAGASFAFRELAERMFLTYWRVPEGDERWARPGVYTSRVYGGEGRRLQVVLLDTRTFKSEWAPTPERKPGQERYVPSDTGELLGEAQWGWLAGVLAEPADVRLVVSSLQVHADGHGWERWGLLPHERDRLYAALAARAGGAVVLVSGDRHRAGIYDRELPGGPYPELTTSSLNLSFGGDEEAGPHRLGPTYVGENFGVVTVDWAAGTAALSVRDVAGEEVLAHTVEIR